MRLGETNPELRRIQLTILVADGSVLASSADALSPTVLVALNSAALVAASGTLGHVSNESRLHYYEASAAEATTPGFLLVVVIAAGIQTAIGWAAVGQIFALGETDPGKLRLPLTIYDTSSPPALAIGATVTTSSDLRSSLNAQAFADDAGSLVEIKQGGTGYGAYYWQAVAAAAAELGTATVKYESTGFALCLSMIDVEAPGGDGSEVAPAGPDAILSFDVGATEIVPVDLLALALSRLPHQYRGSNG